MMKGAETVDSPENVQAETGHHVSTYHRGNATEKEFHPQVGGGQEIMVAPGPLLAVASEIQHEVVGEAEAARGLEPDGVAVPGRKSEDKDNDGRDTSSDKDKRSGFLPWESTAVAEMIRSRGTVYVFEFAAKAALGHEKEERAEDGDEEVTRAPQGTQKAYHVPYEQCSSAMHLCRALPVHPRGARSTATP